MSGGDSGARAAAEREEFAAFFPQIVRDLTEDMLGHPEVGDAVARLNSAGLALSSGPSCCSALCAFSTCSRRRGRGGTGGGTPPGRGRGSGALLGTPGSLRSGTGGGAAGAAAGSGRGLQLGSRSLQVPVVSGAAGLGESSSQ
uniref:Uncharacterized protein n=1 Tax=Junco hyemalis TaxID=40217 RepID=A0A8C5J3S3_JUNHY